MAGTIYGVVLNDAAERDALREQFDVLPYNAPPRAPVVYIKPRLCVTEHGTDVPLPAGVEALQASATIALVFTRGVSSGATMPLGSFALARIALDICIPHANYYRPAIAERCRDGFLPVGAPMAIDGDLGDLTIVTEVDGANAHRWSLSRLVRPIDALIAELSAFMTLRAGDTLLVGLPGDAPLVRDGQAIRVTAGTLPPLETRVMREILP